MLMRTPSGSSPRNASNGSRIGATRAHSASLVRDAPPGRVDSPPMSIMCTPADNMARTWGSTVFQPVNWPPSENESGVALMIPIHSGMWSESWREQSSNVLPPAPGGTSRGCRATIGVSTKLRSRSPAWGIVSDSVCSCSLPHRRMSISIGRGDQRGPAVRPRARSISTVQARTVRGVASVSHSTARLRNGRRQSVGESSGNNACDSTTGETRSSVSRRASRSFSACARLARRSP